MKSLTRSPTPQPSRHRQAPEAAPSFRSEPLSRPGQIRAVAAQLFNQGLKRWSRGAAKVTDARALLALLKVTGQAIADVDIDARIAKLEAEFRTPDAEQAASGSADDVEAKNCVTTDFADGHG